MKGDAYGLEVFAHFQIGTNTWANIHEQRQHKKNIMMSTTTVRMRQKHTFVGVSNANEHTGIHTSIHSCIYIYICTCIHTYIHTYTHTHAHTPNYTRNNTHIVALIHTRMRTPTFTIVNVCMDIYIYIYIHTYVCIARTSMRIYASVHTHNTKLHPPGNMKVYYKTRNIHTHNMT